MASRRLISRIRARWCKAADAARSRRTSCAAGSVFVVWPCVKPLNLTPCGSVELQGLRCHGRSQFSPAPRTGERARSKPAPQVFRIACAAIDPQLARLPGFLRHSISHPDFGERTHCGVDHQGHIAPGVVSTQICGSIFDDEPPRSLAASRVTECEVDDDRPGWKFLDAVPHNNSRMINGDQRSHKASAARATVQNWPYPFSTASLLTETL